MRKYRRQSNVHTRQDQAGLTTPTTRFSSPNVFSFVGVNRRLPQTYGGFVYTLADLRQCAKADVFVGTFSSNMGRLLVLLRESIGLKPRHSAISVDRSWTAGR